MLCVRRTASCSERHVLLVYDRRDSRMLICLLRRDQRLCTRTSTCCGIVERKRTSTTVRAAGEDPANTEVVVILGAKVERAKHSDSRAFIVNQCARLMTRIREEET